MLILSSSFLPFQTSTNAKKLPAESSPDPSIGEKVHHQTVEALDYLQHATEPVPGALEYPEIGELRSMAAQAFYNLKDTVQPVAQQVSGGQ